MRLRKSDFLCRISNFLTLNVLPQAPMATAIDAVGEREEGEIVESIEYEDISSDEEFTLRLRIEELEARNFELEQIANISGLATNPYELSE